MRPDEASKIPNARRAGLAGLCIDGLAQT
jgi:hypothetical protein